MVLARIASFARFISHVASSHRSRLLYCLVTTITIAVRAGQSDVASTERTKGKHEQHDVVHYVVQDAFFATCTCTISSLVIWVHHTKMSVQKYVTCHSSRAHWLLHFRCVLARWRMCVRSSVLDASCGEVVALRACSTSVLLAVLLEQYERYRLLCDQSKLIAPKVTIVCGPRVL